jgi:hypothetical protein
VSTKGGSEPRWRADGKELYFLSPDGRLMAVSVKIDGATFEAGTPLALFETSARSNTRVGWAYDVTRDGERFILLESAGAPQINLLINWQAALSR